MINDFEKQLDKIRVDLYESTKNLTNGEAVRLANENAKAIADQFGLKMTEGINLKDNANVQAL